jgi:uncharacterized membrane protein YeaQ/YmgE (transglycosylase-associated protein family)
VGLALWLIFGALAGWAANLIVGGRARRRLGCLFNILVGIVGAVLGGLIYRAATGTETLFRFNLSSLGLAILGAVVLLLIVRLITEGLGRRRDRRDS